MMLLQTIKSIMYYNPKPKAFSSMKYAIIGKLKANQKQQTS